MNIEIDTASGFCFGVTTAIKKAEQELATAGHLYCLGDIVHNSSEVERLKALGLETITHEQMQALHGVKVLLRAHGEPPETYALARANNIEIIDATCPVVIGLQKRIATTYRQTEGDAQIVIYGKRGHAEVLGLVGQTQSKALVIENIDEIEKIDFTRDVYLYSQTTKSVQEFKRISETIAARLEASGTGAQLHSFDTICRSVANRIPQIRDFAQRHELILFVSGTKSSNGRILFAECLAANPNSHLITGTDDIDHRWLEGVSSVGICGATSTPRWLMNQVKATLENQF